MAKVLSIKNAIVQADGAEAKKDIPVAIKEYEEAIKNNPLEEKAYDRLMIVYRKEKNYIKELKIINTGIKAFQNFYKSRKSGSKKIAEISKNSIVLLDLLIKKEM